MKNLFPFALVSIVVIGVTVALHPADAYVLKQSSIQRPLQFKLYQSGSAIPYTSVSPSYVLPTVTLSKNGAAFAAANGTVSNIGNGWFQVAPNITDNNTLGILTLFATAMGADSTDSLFEVVAYDPADSSVLGLSGVGTTINQTTLLGNQTTLLARLPQAILFDATGNVKANALALPTVPPNGYGTAADPWSTALPGSYSAGTAGSIVGTLISTVPAATVTALKADAQWKLLVSHASGKYTYVPSTGVLTLFDTDGVTVLKTLTLTRDALGNTTLRQ